ncbi:MAG: hypothetical protein HGA28_00040 [Anaerolineaceae bacterium]|nr:hypothetical protein [Anaerolineaceae bacterium]
MREFRQLLAQQMRPRFHEITAYLIALSFCWLFVFHPELRLNYYLFLTGFESMSPFFLAFGLIVTAGLLLSLIHGFIKRKKLALEKAIIGWAILVICSIASFLVGSEMLPSRSFIVSVLVTWNILMSIVLLIQMGTQNYEISDVEASFAEVLVTTAILLIILFVSDIYLRLSWAMTLSICIFYATSIVFVTAWVSNRFNIQIPDYLK